MFYHDMNLYCVCVFTDFVRQHWFEAATEVAEDVSVLVNLHSFSVVLDLRVHAVWTFLHGLLDGFTCLCLKTKMSQTESIFSITVVDSPCTPFITG